MTTVPFTVDARPDTGVNNVMLGMWLFLASEVMLFGGLFSAYVLLRTGAAEWPRGGALLNVRLGSLNTVVLMAATAAVFGARRPLSSAQIARSRLLLGASACLGAVFLAVKSVEYASELRSGMYPSSSTFLALYYLLTGVHALHIVGAVIAAGYLALAGLRSTGGDIPRLANRVRAVTLYCGFVDVVWISIFVTLYLA
jgi:cytochrome c oxidase subunit III